jgi:uncharacterized phage-like protein YoqJ
MAFVAAITGHRPEKINNWTFVEYQIALALRDNRITLMIQGMAAGVDLRSARVAFAERIPFVAARPWAGHTPRVADRIDYYKAITHAQRVVDVDPSEDYPGSWVYQKRNEWMVDNADMVIAVWDGTSGGTANCVKYAQKQGVAVWRINPATHVVGWLDAD